MNYFELYKIVTYFSKCLLLAENSHKYNYLVVQLHVIFKKFLNSNILGTRSYSWVRILNFVPEEYKNLGDEIPGASCASGISDVPKIFKSLYFENQERSLARVLGFVSEEYRSLKPAV